MRMYEIVINIDAHILEMKFNSMYSNAYFITIKAEK